MLAGSSLLMLMLLLVLMMLVLVLVLVLQLRGPRAVPAQLIRRPVHQLIASSAPAPSAHHHHHIGRAGEGGGVSAGCPAHAGRLLVGAVNVAHLLLQRGLPRKGATVGVGIAVLGIAVTPTPTSTAA